MRNIGVNDLIESELILRFNVLVLNGLTCMCFSENCRS